MQCPKCGSGVGADATNCPICYAPLDEAPKQAGPIGLQIPTTPAVPREEDYMPSAGIPGIDNRPPALPAENRSRGQQSGMGMQSGTGEFRTSLTREVIEVQSAGPANPAAGPIPPRPMGGPIPAAPIPTRAPMG